MIWTLSQIKIKREVLHSFVIFKPYNFILK
jgi:hypothetical protein